ncbi:hypothetical protein QQ045_011807 [Rhodiola kirilowii]
MFGYIVPKIPMLAPSYVELNNEDTWNIVYNHISIHFEVSPDIAWMWDYIGGAAADRYKDWKSKCRTHWKIYDKEAKSRNMSYARSKKMNHRSGKVLFAHRAKTQLLKGHKAPHVEVYGEAYAGEPAAAKIVEKMENKVLYMFDEDGSSLDEPLSKEIQFAIISEAVGEKKGT